MTPPVQPGSPIPLAAPGLRLVQEPLGVSGAVLSASGELDIATSPELRASIDAAFAAGINRLVIDLDELAFLDSVAVAVLLHARRQLGEGGRMAVVVGPDSYARLIFEVAGLSHRLGVLPTRAEAIVHVSP